jgi:RNase H-like domain found in reverse transcriptase
VIQHYPQPENAKDIRKFLGMVRFVVGYLSEALTEHTSVLTPLTQKECNKEFPKWSPDHKKAFLTIKQLIIECAVLAYIDHDNPGDNKIFLVTDASDHRTGGVLMWGPSLNKAHPVAFNSQQLSGPELNYPVHKKELLAIV